MSDYVLRHLKRSDVITDNSTLNNLHQNLNNKDMANYESGEKYKRHTRKTIQVVLIKFRSFYIV